MAKDVHVDSYRECHQCRKDGVITMAKYAIPNGKERLFHGDDPILKNARFLCEKHFTESDFNSIRFQYSVGRLVYGRKVAC